MIIPRYRLASDAGGSFGLQYSDCFKRNIEEKTKFNILLVRGYDILLEKGVIQMMAKRIAVLRKKQHLSQAEFAHKLNISASTEGMYEQGRRTPSLDILIMMAKQFNVSLDYLITGSEYEYSVVAGPGVAVDN